MSELLDRAKQSLSDHQWAKSCRVESLYPEQIVRELIAEVERLEKLQTNYFRCAEALTEWRGRAMKAESEAESVKYQLEDECESHRETITERDHWKALWQGTVEYSTKIIQERDEALRELEEERESHRETAEIMRRTRERAERLEKRAIPETVTRIDMIDPKRQEHWSDYWSVSIQDEGRTLKLFAEGDGSAAREERDAALAKTISEDLRRLGGSDE
ncbi:hypothetical protein PP563_09895 [Mycobacteroides abscessus]|nr:hypothetical protein [Mycobacteroides abscessus]MDM2387298.1 hypothetical protein [Mycobacteroides abscessus]